MRYIVLKFSLKRNRALNILASTVGLVVLYFALVVIPVWIDDSAFPCNFVMTS